MFAAGHVFNCWTHCARLHTNTLTHSLTHSLAPQCLARIIPTIHTHIHTTRIHIRDNSNDDASIWFLIIICPWYSDVGCACSLYNMYALNRVRCDDDDNDDHHSSSLLFLFLFSNVIQIDALNMEGIRLGSIVVPWTWAHWLRHVCKLHIFLRCCCSKQKKHIFLFCRILCSNSNNIEIKRAEENRFSVSRSSLYLFRLFVSSRP